MPKGKCSIRHHLLELSDYSNTQTSSRNYTGRGTANYPNGDTFTGDFLDGVSFNCFPLFRSLKIKQS